MTVSTCKSCGGEKPQGQGRKLCDGCRVTSTERTRARQREHGRDYYQRNKDRIGAQSRAWATSNPEKAAAIKRKSYEAEKASGKRHARNLAKFGLTPADYERLLAHQGAVCAICGGVDGRRRLNVDHDHATGEVRGLLCSGCNGARLGRLGDDVEKADARARYYEERARLLRGAIEYLVRPPARDVLGGESR